MNWAQRSKRCGRAVALFAGAAAGLLLSGCGMPGAPMPPSLNLADPVNDLAASRTGSQVTLTWTMPRRDTDKLLLMRNVDVRICRKEGSGPCVPAGNVALAPLAKGAFTDTLPPELAVGAPRVLNYFAELRNRNGRSAGLSNAAAVLAGEAPQPVSGLDAELRRDGVVLRWSAAADAPAATVIRLHRKRLTAAPEPKSKAEQGLLAPAPEAAEKSLLVESGMRGGRALDKDIRFGETYEYRAQRVARITVGGQTVELAGPLTAPVRVEAVNVFPPAVPTELAAVATAGEAGSAPAIDLSWQAGTEADLAGYIVYRRQGTGAWQRISPAQPVVGPAFHDAQVEAGQSYRYAVTAIDQEGHESARSAEAEETVTGP